MMTNQPVRHVVLPTTRDRARNAVLGSFGFLHYVDTGDRLLLHDGERRMEVEIVLAEAVGGSAEGPPEQVRFSFVGYSEEEADQLIDQFLTHSLRNADGSLTRSRDRDVL